MSSVIKFHIGVGYTCMLGTVSSYGVGYELQAVCLLQWVVDMGYILYVSSNG